MSIEAMKQAMEALTTTNSEPDSNQWKKEILAIQALRESIEQAEHAQPVGEIQIEDMGRPFNAMRVTIHFYKEVPPVGTRIYTTTPKRNPLSPEEIEQCCYDTDSQVADHPQTWKWTEGFARAIEAAHGIKGQA